METLQIFRMIENFGVEIFVMAFAVCAASRLFKKIFPRASEKTLLAFRIALSVFLYAAYIAAINGDFSIIAEKSLTVFGVSFAICNLFGKSGGSPVIGILSLYVDEKLAKEVAAALSAVKTEEEAKAVLSDMTELDEKEIDLISAAVLKFGEKI